MINRFCQPIPGVDTQHVCIVLPKQTPSVGQALVVFFAFLGGIEQGMATFLSPGHPTLGNKLVYEPGHRRRGEVEYQCELVLSYPGSFIDQYGSKGKVGSQPQALKRFFCPTGQHTAQLCGTEVQAAV